jgi:hypothetical protein
MSVDRATSRGIPSDAKLESHDEGEISHVSCQSDIEMCIIGSPVNYMPTTMTIARPWTEIYAGEFSQMRNQKQVTKLRYRSVMVKVMLKYTLLGQL